MRRIKLKRKHFFKHKFTIGEKIIIIISLLIIFIIILFRYISKNMTPVFLNYAHIETKKFIGAVINKAVNETKINENNLFILNNQDNEISTIDFNMNTVNEVLINISTKIQDCIKAMDNKEYINIPGYDSEKLKKGIIYELPTGLIFKNNILSNVGPKIPVKLSMRGSIISNIDTKVINYGINNALVKIYINLTIDQQVVLPFTLERVEVNTSIPVAIKLIKGTVPKYYSNGIESSSPMLSIPLDEN